MSYLKSVYIGTYRCFDVLIHKVFGNRVLFSKDHELSIASDETIEMNIAVFDGYPVFG